MGKHLYRSTTNRWISGVCGGIAEYTGVPALLIRLLWVALSLVALPFSLIIGNLVYIAAMSLMPQTPARRIIDDPTIIDATFEVRE